jgi:hypothetical protein
MVRILFFIAFFSIGLATIAISALVPDFNRYYTIKIQLDFTEKLNEQVQKNIEDNQEMIERIHADPNAAMRLAVVTLGYEPNAPQTAFPKPDRRTMAEAQKAVETAVPTQIQAEQMPVWLARLQNQRMRLYLFLAGSGLVLVSFTCFGPRRAESA